MFVNFCIEYNFYYYFYYIVGNFYKEKNLFMKYGN